MRGRYLGGAIVALGVALAFSTQADQGAHSGLGSDIPRAKQTSLGLYVTAAEAYEMWSRAPEKVRILDVRTPEEYIYIGHAEMAWNVPLMFQTYDWQPEKGEFAYEDNPEFVTRVRAWAEPDDTILVMCRSGGRGAMAVELLVEYGFTDVYNIIDGMEGDKVDDPDSVFRGKRMRNGWKNSGLPWTYKIDPARVLLPE